MTFGQPLTLFPALGAILLGGGAVTTGMLTAAVTAGTFLSILISGRIVQYRWHGRGIARAIQVYGAAILLFGAALPPERAGRRRPRRTSRPAPSSRSRAPPTTSARSTGAR